MAISIKQMGEWLTSTCVYILIFSKFCSRLYQQTLQIRRDLDDDETKRGMKPGLLKQRLHAFVSFAGMWSGCPNDEATCRNGRVCGSARVNNKIIVQALLNRSQKFVPRMWLRISGRPQTTRCLDVSMDTRRPGTFNFWYVQWLDPRALLCRVLIRLCRLHRRTRVCGMNSETCNCVFVRTGWWRRGIENCLGGHQPTGKSDQSIVDNADSSNGVLDAHDRTYAGVAGPNFILLPVHRGLASSVSSNERVDSFPGSKKSRKEML